MLSRTSTPINPRSVVSASLLQAPPPFSPHTASIDPITLVINECMVISSAMRKMNRWHQTGVAAILGGGEIFDEEDGLSNLGLSASHFGSTTSTPRAANGGTNPNTTSNPLHSSFLQLRAILTETSDINDVDSLTILSPFLLAVESSSTTGNVTALALNAINKFLDYGVVGWHSKNIQNSLMQITSSLTHCRFEAADQNSDDSVLLKVLRLLESIVDSPFCKLLPNAVISEVIQTCLSLACNKRRSEVLRRAAEMAMISMTIRVFSRLRELTPETTHADDLPSNYAESHLPADVIGSANSPGESAIADEDSKNPDTPNLNPPTVDLAPTSPKRKPSMSDKKEPQFDIVCINEFLGILICMISPTNQYQHMESTRVFALSLINIAIEIAGTEIPKHPSLMGLVADPVSKDVLQIITSTDSPPLLSAALRLFSTMAIILGKHLKSQIELTFNLLFHSILPPTKSSDNTIKGNKMSVSTRIASSKEAIVESISLLWIRSPQFFSQSFIEYDCDFERFNMAADFVEFLCKLALPEAALISTDNVPPICLEGVLSLVAGINDRIKNLGESKVKPSDEPHHLLIDKEKKTAFVACTEIFNENPKKGVAAFAEKKFLKDANDTRELALLLFHKSSRLNKKILGEYLAKPSNTELLREFMNLFTFAGLRVDEALRLLLKSFRLPGESQQIERIVELFAKAYVECQKDFTPEELSEDEKNDPVHPDQDAVFVLSYSIIMLNTDLHNPQVKKQMDLDSYRRNLKGVNNGKDFPEWYLSKIYNSIRDREIIMPEEHHGTDKWFDDVWHNLISSQTKVSQDREVSLSAIDNATLCQFDKLFFEGSVDVIINTLLQVFREASDDNIITKLMSSIDKCANICIHYGMLEPVNRIIEELTNITHLTNKSFPQPNPEENIRREIPITQITVEKKENVISISDMAVYFGRDFKAQLAAVVLFRLVKKPECKVSKSWDGVIKVILTLLENCLINPNLFCEFQKKVKLSPLGKVKPRYIIQGTKPLNTSGLLSTFSSFLKGYSDEPPEPTDQEIESTLSTIDCVRSINVPGIFDSVSKGSQDELKLFVNLLLDNLPDYSEDKRRFYESEILFLFEVGVCFSLIVSDPEVTNKLISKLLEARKSQISKRGFVRLSTYLFLLARQSNTSHEAEALETLEKVNTFDREVISKYGASLLKSLFSLVDRESKTRPFIQKEIFWDFLKLAGSSPELADEILDFMETIVKDASDEVSDQNHILLLGLLDEVSSLGAIGAQWEQVKDGAKPGEKSKLVEGTDESNNVKRLIKISMRSIDLTGLLGFSSSRISYPLIQALAHQCFNPCREVRYHACTTLQNTLLSGTLSENFTALGIYEYGLFPLLAELEKEEVVATDRKGFPATHSQVLSIVSKAFLHLHEKLKEDERITVWTGIVNHFVKVNVINSKHEKSVVKESSVEAMKNMILVLQNEFLVPENEELWKFTWKNLEQVYPGLENEVQAK